MQKYNTMNLKTIKKYLIHGDLKKIRESSLNPMTGRPYSKNEISLVNRGIRKNRQILSLLEKKALQNKENFESIEV